MDKSPRRPLIPSLQPQTDNTNTMWAYETSVTWKEGLRGEIHAGGKPALEIATPPEFGGPPNIWTPEDLLTSAVASCLLTSTLFYAGKARIEMRSYMSNATGTMEKTSAGLAITKVKVDISIMLVDGQQEAAMHKAVERAKRTCPISNSLKCAVETNVTVSAQTG